MTPEVIGQSAPEWWTWLAANSESLRNLALTLGAVLAAIVGLPLLIWRTWNVHRQSKAALKQAETAAQRHYAQVEADRERRITDSFTRAVEQLGSEKLETRLGAIYALERIAQESPRDHWPIMETLTAFVRERAPWTPEKAQEAVEQGPAVQPATDVQAVLTVIGRRRREHDRERQRLNLRLTDLRCVDLTGSHLERAFLVLAHLEGACLVRAHLEGARLFGAHLESALLAGSNLRQTHLQSASLAGAHLEDADLRGSDVTQEQLDQAFTDENTKVPPGLRIKARRSGEQAEQQAREKAGDEAPPDC